MVDGAVVQHLDYGDIVDTLVLDYIGSLTESFVQMDYFGDYMIEDNAHLEGKGIWLMIV